MSTQTKHTPGPWHIIGKLGNRASICNSTWLEHTKDSYPASFELEHGPAKCVADVRGPGNGYPSSIEAEANARLIAAAPEMRSSA